MESFLHRLVRLNARFFVENLRRLADEIELLYPGPPVMGFLILSDTGGPHLNEIRVSDTETRLRYLVRPLDVEGAVTKFSDDPVASSSDETVCTPVPDADDLYQGGFNIGTVGEAIVSVSGTGVDETGAAVTLTFQAKVIVDPGAAVSGDLILSLPSEPTP